MVRVRKDVYDRVAQTARERGYHIQALLSRLIEEAHRKEFGR